MWVCHIISIPFLDIPSWDRWAMGEQNEHRVDHILCHIGRDGGRETSTAQEQKRLCTGAGEPHCACWEQADTHTKLLPPPVPVTSLHGDLEEKQIFETPAGCQKPGNPSHKPKDSFRESPKELYKASYSR